MPLQQTWDKLADRIAESTAIAIPSPLPNEMEAELIKLAIKALAGIIRDFLPDGVEKFFELDQEAPPEVIANLATADLVGIKGEILDSLIDDDIEVNVDEFDQTLSQIVEIGKNTALIAMTREQGL